MLKRRYVYILLMAALVASISVGDAASVTRSNSLGQNLAIVSEQFDSASWTKNAGATVTANVAQAPDGTMTADRFNATAGANLQQNVPGTYPVGNYTFSIWMRADSSQTVQIRIADSSDGSPSKSVNAAVTTSWTRFSATITTTSGQSGNWAALVFSPNADIYLWGAQIVPGIGFGAYNPTVATAKSSAFVPTGNTRSNSLGQNLITYSEQFDNAAWTKNNVTASADTADTRDPLGGTTAEKITASAGAGNHYLTQSSAISLTNIPRVMTSSAFVKAGTARYAGVGNSRHSLWYRTWFDFNTNTIAANDTGVIGKAIPIGNGWYRVSATYTIPVGTGSPTADDILVAPSDSINLSYTAAGTETVYAWGAQLLQGQPAAYNPTVASAKSATFIPTGVKRSKELGQNLIRFSEEFDNAFWEKNAVSVSANAVQAPDGTMAADKIVEDGTTGLHGLTLSSYTGAATSSGNYTVSIYIKAAERSRIELYKNSLGVNQAIGCDASTGATFANTVSYSAPLGGGSIKPVGGGWYRCSMTFTKTDGTGWQLGVVLNNGTSYSYAGNGSSGLYYFGGQLTFDTKPGAYNKTGRAALNTGYVP